MRRPNEVLRTLPAVAASVAIAVGASACGGKTNHEADNIIVRGSLRQDAAEIGAIALRNRESAHVSPDPNVRQGRIFRFSKKSEAIRGTTKDVVSVFIIPRPINNDRLSSGGTYKVTDTETNCDSAFTPPCGTENIAGIEQSNWRVDDYGEPVGGTWDASLYGLDMTELGATRTNDAFFRKSYVIRSTIEADLTHIVGATDSGQ